MIMIMSTSLPVKLLGVHYRTSRRVTAPLHGAQLATQDYKGGLPGFRLRKVTDLMVTHLEDEFSLIRLAREADMSEFHFSRAFKRTTGLTPSQYFIHLRLEKARRLLRETNRSVIEIGLDVGYTSPSHFAQIFRREVGISPSEYRRLT
jgi:AraC family transcriptional regulator